MDMAERRGRSMVRQDAGEHEGADGTSGLLNTEHCWPQQSSSVVTNREERNGSGSSRFANRRTAQHDVDPSESRLFCCIARTRAEHNSRRLVVRECLVRVVVPTITAARAEIVHFGHGCHLVTRGGLDVHLLEVASSRRQFVVAR